MHRLRIGGTFIILFTFVFLYGYLIWLKQDSMYRIPNSLQKYKIYDKLPLNTVYEVNGLKLKIKEINKKREVRNWKKFGPLMKDTTIILVQVHQDIKSLQYLIISLAQVRYIESALLVFSHSYYSECINRLIHSIDFCKVLQIYYPYSTQLYSSQLPVKDMEDCINESQTTLQNYEMQAASSTEWKHHWWWKANFVFDQMEWSLSYTGSVIFLEEDNYIAPDMLHMLQYVQRSLSYFPDVEIMSLGTIYSRNLNPGLLTLEYWKPPFDVGVTFNKTTWKKIVELSSFYCMYNDCNWSHSLLNVFKNFPNKNINMIACAAPRVISTKQFDNVDGAALELSRVYSVLELFPQKVKAVFLFGPNGRVHFNSEAPPRGNGGWSNLKDHLWCLDMQSTTTEDYEGTKISSRFDQYTD